MMVQPLYTLATVAESLLKVPRMIAFAPGPYA